MHFTKSLFALLSAPLLALAAQPNPFKIPSSGISATGGQPLTLNWTPTTTGSVSLILRSGASYDLDEGTEIVSSIPNSGSYTWTPSNSLTRGSDYTIEIVDDADPSQVNFTPPFVLNTTNTVATSTPPITLGASTTTSGSSTSSPSTSTSSSGSSTATSKKTTTAKSMSSASSSPSSSSGSASANSASSSPPAPSPTGSDNAAGILSIARPTAVAGLLGVVALGALAL